MKILVESIVGRGFRATANDDFPAFAEAQTEEDALAAVRKILEARACGQAQIVTIEMAESISSAKAEAAWNIGQGMFKDAPLFEDWQESVQARRRDIDGDPNVL